MVRIKLSMGAVGREDQDRMSVLVQQHLSDLLTVYTKERVFSTGPEESEAPSRGQHAQLVFPFAPTSLGKFSILTASWKLSSPSSDTLEFDSALLPLSMISPDACAGSLPGSDTLRPSAPTRPTPSFCSAPKKEAGTSEAGII
jgi:hypothetical protein